MMMSKGLLGELYRLAKEFPPSSPERKALGNGEVAVRGIDVFMRGDNRKVGTLSEQSVQLDADVLGFAGFALGTGYDGADISATLFLRSEAIELLESEKQRLMSL